ncbi:cache domain-containing sensor histidine kinase [Paenibacillus protaetiae]|uniref:Sensor histidine kinase n=1 Tax=Paenibacillus protaetiae TaxID=2509456 RepID=A0A4P6F5M3_9BACL|nr:sensor histidine kinase [Paenibacillus protaetiae]QAY68507.1 sensor histidine kinase [Paenibacillus protaetiae]
MKMDSIRTKMIVFMIAVTMVPMVVSLFVTFGYTRESGKEQAIAENTRLIFQGKTNLDNYLSGLSRASLAVYTDPHFVRNLSLSVNDYHAIAEIYTTLQNIQNASSDFVQVYLHSRLTNQSTLVTNSSPTREIRDEPYPGTVDPQNRITYTSAPHQIHSYGFPISPNVNRNLEVFTFYRSVTRVPKPEQLAVLAIDVRLDGIAAITSRLFEPGEEELYLIDGEGGIIYSSNEALIGSKLDNPSLLERIRQGSSGHFDSGNAVHIYEKLNSSFAGWTLVKTIPHHTLYKNSTRLTSINVIIAVATMLIVIFGTLFISIRITSPIQKLAGYMKQIQTGRLDVEIDLQSRDEIGLLARSFRQMMDRINNLILKEYRLELANKNSQLKMLQAQINPHFLYNSLQSIGTLALRHNVPKIYTLLSSLSNLMRYSMRSSQPLVPLRDELDHLRRFLELQKERFGEQFGFTEHVEAASLNAFVPKMILQPLAENYFKHGMHPDYGSGELALSSSLAEDGMLTIVMRNNGAPIAPDKLKELSDMTDRWNEPSSVQDDGSIGLMNVMLRLKLYTDESARLWIENIQPHGVMVTLQFRAEAAAVKEMEI